MIVALLIVGGLIALTAGGEFLVRGASDLATRFGIPPLVIGLTVVAFGTSAPELAVSVGSAWSGKSDLAIGNVVGSNIFNVLLILGLCALITPLTVALNVVKRDVPIMIAASVLLWVLARDLLISRGEAIVLAVGIVAYTAWCLWQGSRERGLDVDPEKSEIRSGSGSGILVMSGVWIGLGLLLLVAGSRMLVMGAVDVAKSMGASELVIGLTIVAAGTSLPEVFASIVAAARKQRDIAVGNVVGSNIFNILSVLGLSGVVSSGGIPVTSTAWTQDIPLMIGVALLCLPIFVSGWVISRREGAVMLVLYFAYLGWLVWSQLPMA